VFWRNDLRGLFREPLLIGVVLAPLGWIALVRFGTPAVADMLGERYGIDLAPYHPVILTGFLLLTSPIVIGAVTALIVLDERDSGTLAALRVSPVSLGSYTAYRAAVAVAVTAIYTVATLSASGLLPPRLVPHMVPIGLVNGACALVIALTILALATNKVEGIAVVRALGILVAGLPLVPYFMDTPWQLLFGSIPTYWPAKAFWVAGQ